jgi:glycosyltransferase involved in cell wall biosynthesis
LYYLKYALQVARDLRSEKCDVVHIQNFSQFATVIREFNPKIKIVLNMHCEWLTQLDQAMIESRLREIDLVIGCSEYITEKIRRRFPHFAERCQTVFDGVDINHFVSKNRRSASQKNGIKQLLFVGRVSPEKGVHVLLDAFQKVIENYPQAQLKIVGGHGSLPIQFEAALSDDPKLSELASFYDGNYFAHLQSKLSADMASHVSFAGSIPHRQLVSLYQNADMLILPTVYGEAFGMPIIEAMAMEVPVVATKCGGIPEIVVDGKTGLLVEGGDSTALAQAILRLLSDEDLRKSMGKAARKRAVELCAWEKIVANLLNYYKKICEGRD